MVLAGDPVVTAVGIAMLFGGVHWLSHMIFGEENTFDDAGVARTGFAIMLLAFVATWMLMEMDTVLDGTGFITSEVVAASLVVFILAIMLMNRGNLWFINIRAQKEPLLLGVGVAVFMLFNNMVAMAAGAILIAVGLLSRFTDTIDV